MAELRRSVTSFRRQGSSGSVWDDKFLSGKPGHNQQENQKLERSRSEGAQPSRTTKVAPPSKDPPSPKVAACGLCGIFGKPAKAAAATRPSNSKSKKPR